MAIVITVIAMKGGVGKTTTVVNTAAALARKGFNVLIVDLDGNGSATASFSRPEFVVQENGECTWNLINGETAAPLILEPCLSLFRGDSRLFQADAQLGQRIGREKLLEKALAAFQKEFDYILLDCPPAWNLLTINSMVAADYYLVPIQAQHLALEALRELVVGVNRIEEGMGKVPVCLGFILTMVDNRVKSTADIVEDVKATLKKDAIPFGIPMNNALAMAPKFGSHIFDYEPGCRGAAAYMLLAGYVTGKTMVRRPKADNQKRGKAA